jgi:hypothetical protein
VRIVTAKNVYRGPGALSEPIERNRGGLLKSYLLPEEKNCVKWYVGVVGDRLCGLVVRVPGYRSGGPGSIPGTKN